MSREPPIALRGLSEASRHGHTFTDSRALQGTHYFNTTATYNENGGWNIGDENALYNICEKLSERRIKWGMSNIFENKNIINEKLIKWCNDNNLNIYTFDKFTYMACGKGNSNAKEVSDM